MASVDMCKHSWPGSGCKDCRIERLEEEFAAERSLTSKVIDNSINTSAKQSREIFNLKQKLAEAERENARTHNRAIRLAAAQVILGDTVTNTQRKILALEVVISPHTYPVDLSEKPAQRFEDISPLPHYPYRKGRRLK